MKERLIRGAARAAMKQRWLVELLGRDRQRGTDTELDPQVAAALAFQRLARMPALELMEPAAARRYAESGMSPLDVDREVMDEVIDTHAAEVPVRIYVPPRVTGAWIVYFHGGGGVIGSIEGSDAVTRYLAAHTGATVASVGYRLGPEYKHPIAIDDAFAAYRALLARVPSAARVGVAGDSFGGFLAAHVDRRARQAKVRPPDVQALIYPIVDLTLRSPSIARYADGYLLTSAMMHWFRDNYLRSVADAELGSPWFWPDVAASAPALIVTAAFDPLVDEGDGWADRLRAAGVPVRHRREPGLVHGFLSLAGAVDAARAATDRICADLVELLRS